MTESTTLLSGNYKLHFQQWKFAENHKSPAILLLHEGLGCTAMWKNFPEQLSAVLRLNVYSYDRIGYGLSDPPNNARKPDYMHLEAYVHLPVVLDTIPEEEVVLLGHSDGGTIALLSKHPKVKAVITMAAHVIVEDITIQGIREAVSNDTKSLIVSKLKRYHGSSVEAVFNRWADIWLSPDFRNWDIRNELKNLHCPVLAMQGAQDEYGSILQLIEIKKFTKGSCRLVMFPKAGHSLHRDAGKRLIYECYRFLEDGCI